MAVIIKCDRFETILASGTVVAAARTFKGAAPAIGDRVFVWTSEVGGGRGLVLAGEIRGVAEIGGGLTRLIILPDGRRLATPLLKADLAPFRTGNAANPLAGLAKKLYYHAHNKIAALTPAEAAFLDQHLAPR